jgi:catechol 2,3-dioxygenase-like lactoylglutathione lyase family enzyme
MISKLRFVSVIVSDQDAAVRFYTEVLGFEKRMELHFPGFPRFLTVAPVGQKEVELVLTPSTGTHVRTAEGHTGKVFWTDDCRRDFAALAARGVRFTAEPSDLPFGVQASFVDPDGNLFSLTEPRRR